MEGYLADLRRQRIASASLIKPNGPQSYLKTGSHDAVVEKPKGFAMPIRVASLPKVLLNGNSGLKALGKRSPLSGALFNIANGHVSYSIGHESKTPQQLMPPGCFELLD